MALHHIYVKKNFWWLYLVLDHQKKKKFFDLNYTKYNKKKPEFTSQQTQGKYI